MSKLTARQVAVMRKAEMLSVPSHASTTWLTPSGMTVSQTAAACRQLEPKGYMTRQNHHGQMWAITVSGRMWLRSLDAGRPWMVRAVAAAAAPR